MFRTFMTPEPGHRTYRIMILTLVCAFILALVGIILNRDLTGLGLVVGAFAGAISGAAALNNRGIAVNPANTGKDA